MDQQDEWLGIFWVRLEHRCLEQLRDELGAMHAVDVLRKVQPHILHEAKRVLREVYNEGYRAGHDDAGQYAEVP
jgi:hypothetical protein